MNSPHQPLPMVDHSAAAASQPQPPDLDLLRERAQSLATELDRMQCALRGGGADAGHLEYCSWLALLGGLRH